jgi:hypothetical protein
MFSSIAVTMRQTVLWGLGIALLVAAILFLVAVALIGSLYLDAASGGELR